MPREGLAEWSAVDVHRAGPQTSDESEKLALAIIWKSVLPVELSCVFVDKESRFAAIPAAVASSLPDEASHRVGDCFTI
jgi:hypothetical protein